MMRPDQPLFDSIVTPINRLDPVFESISARYNLTLERNPGRQPGRLLRDPTDSGKLIQLYLEPVWHSVTYSEDLPYTLAVCAYYEEPDGDHRLWKLDETLTSNKPLAWLETRLSDLLEMAVAIMQTYSEKKIIAGGIELENSVYKRRRALDIWVGVVPVHMESRFIYRCSDCEFIGGDRRRAEVLRVIHRRDGHWIFTCGDLDPSHRNEYAAEVVTNFTMRDPSLNCLVDLPPRWEARRVRVGADWERIPYVTGCH